MAAKLFFYYQTDGTILLCCDSCDYRNTMFSEDLFPTENVWAMKFTVDQLYHGLKHLSRHAKRGMHEREDNATNGSDVHLELRSRDAGVAKSDQS